MVENSVLISVFLITAGCSAVACALYTIQENYKLFINKLFLALGASILIWSFGLAIQTSGADASIRFIGSRIAPIGYAMLFGILLHYVLLLTCHDRLLKKWWIYPLIYLPGMLTIYGFSIWPITVSIYDTMIRTDFGWVNVSSNGWVNFFYCYYAVFSVIILLLLWNWHRTARQENQRKQALLLLLSILGSIVLGSVTDVWLVMLKVRIPGMASIFSILPVLAISYSVHRYGFMQPEKTDPNEIILDKPNRTRVYRIMGLFFVGGSLINVLGQYVFYQETALSSVFFFSGLLLFAGCVILALNKLRVDELFKELLFAAIFSLLIPLVILRFVIYASITIWVHFFLLLMISLLFNKHILLTSVLLSAAQTLLLVWSISPAPHVRIDSADYMIRLGLIALTAALAVYINGIYRHRLTENARHAYRQRLVSEISQSLVSVDEQNLGERMLFVLSQCGAYLQCERAYLTLWGQKTGEVGYRWEWLAEGVPSLHESCVNGMALLYSQMDEQLADTQMLALSDISALPPQVENARVHLQGIGIRGLALLPVLQKGLKLGFMCFAAAAQRPDWDCNPPAFLPIVANTVADAVTKLEDTRKIEWTAYHDLLTGLPNRILFKSRLDQAIALAGESGGLIGVAFIDLDAFKAINDTMGHETGDKLLVEVADVISGCVRPQDTVARFGGDEFVLLLNQVSGEDELNGIIKEVLEAIQNPILLKGQEFYVTSSIGVSIYPQDGTDSEALLKNADIAMYEAKSQGRNQFALCSQTLKDKALDNARLTNLLFRALEREQLAVYYQPQISLDTGEIVGLEALLRWKLPGEGFISPAVFIPLAEQSGLIQSIGAWVLEIACAQCKRWQDIGFPPVRMAVNISVQQLENKNFAHLVATTLVRTGLSPQWLELEVTESVANSGAANMVELMNRLKEIGLSISIDDFGTEYSSLERLKLLPIDRIKMDIQFVRGIEKSDKDRAIAQIIINLAKSLDLKVIAEGVETPEQLDFLSQRMCDEVQGYYYYKPMPPEQLEKVFRNGFEQASVGQDLRQSGAALPVE
ncbi:MAG: EAL domain-containing protein [Bacillota bacterium]